MINRQIQKECKKLRYRRIINPTIFARELVDAVSNDPGSENKVMLFYVDDTEVGYVGITSEARITVLKLTKEMKEIKI
jgi:hypothetical protein